jgi:hypothetical protein
VRAVSVTLFVAVRKAPRTAAARFTPWFTPQGPTKENGLAPFGANPLILLAEWTGLEPATPGVTGRYSNQLNYHSVGLDAGTNCLQLPDRQDFRIAPQALPNLASPRGFEPL